MKLLTPLDPTVRPAIRRMERPEARHASPREFFKMTALHVLASAAPLHRGEPIGVLNAVPSFPNQHKEERP